MPVASVVARIKAADADIGANAEMEYKIVDGDGLGIFKISVDKDTQEGIITIQKVIFSCFYFLWGQHHRDCWAAMSALMEECIIRQTECPHETIIILILGRKAMHLFLGVRIVGNLVWHL